MNKIDRLGRPLLNGPWRGNVRAASLVNVPLLHGEQAVGGVPCRNGDRVLLTAQTDARQNGPWIISTGAWRRPADFSDAANALGARFYVEEGPQAGSDWHCTTPAPITIGSTNLTITVRGSGAIVEGDYTTAAGREAAATALTVTEYAFRRIFGGPDGGTQLRIEYTPSAVEEWRVSGGIANGGPVLAAWSETRTNVSGTIALKGTGGLFVGNGSGVLGGFIDNGSGLLAGGYCALMPGSGLGAAGVVAQGSGNVSMFLQPLGNGALTRNQPDGTVAGGIQRGARAVDWQGQRSFNTSVAQTTGSVIGGGQDNNIGADIGGQFQVIAGGHFNTLRGWYSWCPGGFLGNDRSRYGVGVWSNGQFGVGGDQQSSEGLLRALATNATPVRLTADGQSAGAHNAFTLPNNGSYLITALLLARQSGGSSGAANDCAWRHVTFQINRGANAAATRLVGTVSTLASGSDAPASTWAWSVTADTTNGGVNISFTGQADKTIRTVARLSAVEVA